MNADELDDYLDLLTEGDIFGPQHDLVIGFDNHMFPKSSISLGCGVPVAMPEQICIQGREGVVARFTQAGLVLKGVLLDDAASMRLLERLFQAPVAYEMRTAEQVSFKVTKGGDVFVNGRKIGRSRRLLPAMLAHMLLSVFPLGKHWLPQIQTKSKRRVSCKR